jgi:putative heme-binding domain-containing protein
VPIVRRAAATAAGKLALKQAAESLLKLAGDPDAGVRRASLDALRQLREPRAVPLAVVALDDRVTQLAALDCLAEMGGPEQAGTVTELARRAPPADVLARAVRLLAAWTARKEVSAAHRGELDRKIAEVHGATGALIRWAVCGPMAAKDATRFVEKHSRVPAGAAAPPDWRPLFAEAPEWRVKAGPPKDATADTVWLAQADIVVAEPTPVEFTLTGAGDAEVWLNTRSLHRRAEASADRNAIARFQGELTRGPNRLLVWIGSPGAAEYGLTFRRRSAAAAHERLTRAALTQAGNAERGRAVFFDTEKSLCLKCHRVGDQGERVGPELTGIGARFGRVYLVESILDPGRSLVSGFATLLVELRDGRLFTGVKVAETDATLTLVDREIKKHELRKSQIVEQRTLAGSTMPDGLEKRLTEQEFVDLIAYLVSLKDRGP